MMIITSLGDSDGSESSRQLSSCWRRGWGGEFMMIITMTMMMIMIITERMTMVMIMTKSPTMMYCLLVGGWDGALRQQYLW